MTQADLIQNNIDLLKGSIQKWKDIICLGREEEGPVDCPLCHAYHPLHGGYPNCEECPISEYTGLRACRETPYDLWDRFFAHYMVRPKRCRNYYTFMIAYAMLNFLRKLLRIERAKLYAITDQTAKAA